MIDLRLLGSIEVRSGHPGSGRTVLTQPKRVALLIYLALAEPAGLHSRDRLLALLWPEGDDASARHSLRNALHALRQATGDGAIVTRGEAWVGLDFDGLRCDAIELRSHLAAGRLDAALALGKGELAPGFHLSGAPDFERWLDKERVTLARAVRAAAWQRADALEHTGPAGLEALRQAVRLDPGDEPGARRLMRMLAAAGDRAGALRAYQDLAGWLTHELDAQPSVETQLLAAEMRAAGPMPTGAQTPAIEAPPDAFAEARYPPPEAVSPRPTSWRRLMAPVLIVAMALAGGVLLARGTGRSVDPTAEAERAVLRLPARYRADTSAYSSYLRGLTLRFQFRFAASRDTLASLVDREPLYVPGIYGLAHAWLFLALNDLTDPDEAWPGIDALARRALALDSTAASAWLVLASEDMFAHNDLRRAGERILRARSLDSLEPDVPGMRSVWFRFRGEMDSAVAEARLAHRLDPLSLYYARLVAKQLFFARRYEESRQVYDRLLRDTPWEWRRGYLDLAQLHAAMGRPRESVRWLRRAREAEADSAAAAALGTAKTDAEAMRLIAADARRTIARLERQAREGEPVGASSYAEAYALVGDTAATLAWLDSMLVRRDSYTHNVRVDPVFDFVRAEPGYRAWEERSGLPQ